MVVTDNHLNPNVRSKWENPFMAGRPNAADRTAAAPEPRRL